VAINKILPRSELTNICTDFVPKMSREGPHALRVARGGALGSTRPRKTSSSSTRPAFHQHCFDGYIGLIWKRSPGFREPQTPVRITTVLRLFKRVRAQTRVTKGAKEAPRGAPSFAYSVENHYTAQGICDFPYFCGRRSVLGRLSLFFVASSRKVNPAVGVPLSEQTKEVEMQSTKPVAQGRELYLLFDRRGKIVT